MSSSSPDPHQNKMHPKLCQTLLLNVNLYYLLGVNYTLFMGDAQVQAETAAHPTFLTWLGYVNRVYMNPGRDFNNHIFLKMIHTYK